MHYRREIDGLRALAVIPVILFHAGSSVFSGGFVGVDVFFVISGYLITSILIAELEQGSFSIARFYERRARRLLPALFTVILLCIPFAWAWMLPSQFKDFCRSIAAILLFSANIQFWREEGYFAAAAELKPLLHTWSLAVEEQYYLLFPLLLLLFWRRLGRTRLLWAVALVAAASLLLSEWGWRHSPSANFYLAPTRFWELLAGSICAFLTVGQVQRTNNWFSAAGLSCLLLAVFLYDSDTPFPSLYTLLPVVGTGLIILYAGADTWTARLLSTRAFVGIGMISYSAYLWHQPLFAFARIRSTTEPAAWLMLLLAGLSFGLAYLTWRFVEQPFRKRPVPLLAHRNTVFAASVAMGTVLFVFAVSGHATRFHKASYPSPDFVVRGEWELPRINNGWCFYSVDSLRSLPIGSNGLDCRLGSPERTSQALLFGDSFAGHYEPFWDEVGKRLNLSVNSVTTNWCFPSLNESFPRRKTSRAYEQCLINRAHLQKSLAQYDVVILSAAWAAVEDKGFTPDVVELIKFIADNSQSKIILMPSPGLSRRKSVEDFVITGAGALVDDEHAEASAERVHDRLRVAAKEYPRVTFLEESDVFGGTRQEPAELTDDGFPYSLEGSHISIYGSREAADTFLNSAGFAALEKFLVR